MVCPRPNTHEPNPTAVPIKEAIKETFRVLMVHPRLLDTTKTPVSFHPGSAILPLNLAPQHKSGVMFPNLSGSPMDLGNLLNRSILPALNRCAACGKPKEECQNLGKGKDIAVGHKFERDKILPEWHARHAARRGLGTDLYRLGVPEKTENLQQEIFASDNEVATKSGRRQTCCDPVSALLTVV
jgi:hypothetical protein